MPYLVFKTLTYTTFVGTPVKQLIQVVKCSMTNSLNYKPPFASLTFNRSNDFDLASI